MYRSCRHRITLPLLVLVPLLLAPRAGADNEPASEPDSAHASADESDRPRKKKKVSDSSTKEESPELDSKGKKAASDAADLPRSLGATEPSEGGALPEQPPSPAEGAAAPSKRKVDTEAPAAAESARETQRKKSSQRRPRRAPEAPDEVPVLEGGSCSEELSQACLGACIDITCQICTGWCAFGAVVGGVAMGLAGASISYFAAQTLQPPDMDDAARSQEALQSAWVGGLVGAATGAIVGGGTGLLINAVSATKPRRPGRRPTGACGL